MIKLNLLPAELRVKKETSPFGQLPEFTKVPLQFITKIPFQFIYLYIGGALLALYTVVFLIVMVNGHRLKGLQEEWARMAPQHEEITQLSREYEALEAKERAVERLDRQFSWSRKLKQLSDAMVWGIWFREVSLGERYPEGEGGVGEIGSPQKLLILTGSAASSKGDQTALVGRFIRSLKENQDFFADFSEVELESIKRRAIHSMDVMDFKIICTFREATFE